MQNYLPPEYFTQPQLNKPKAQIYQELDRYSSEIRLGQELLYPCIDFYVICPPLFYDGIFLKGLYQSQGIEALNELCPGIQDLFSGIATSASCAYPQADSAVAYLTGYRCAEREAYFRETQPGKQSITLLPKSTSVVPVDDYQFGPVYPQALQKNIQLLYVTELKHTENLPLLAEALKIYRSKYQQPLKLSLVTSQALDLNLGSLQSCSEARAVYRQLEEILGHTADYLEFLPPLPQARMAEYYSQAKFCISAALLQGSSAMLQQAQSCNTPVICSAQLDQYLRDAELFGVQQGLIYQDFEPECIADTIHQALSSYGDFQPRRAYQAQYGRRRYFTDCVDALEYYQLELPGYAAGQHLQNEWLSEAIVDNYRLSLQDFIYGGNQLNQATGLEQISKQVNYYAEVVSLRVSQHLPPEQLQALQEA